MNLRIILISGLLIQFSISCNQSGLAKQIESLEKSNDANPDFETSQQLVKLYEEYVANNPGDHEASSRYLYRAASLQYRMNKYAQATMLLNQALKDHLSGSNSPNNALLLASIYQDVYRNSTAATAVRQAFLIAFPDNDQAEKVKNQIPPGTAPLEEWIDGLSEKLYDEATKRINYSAANNYISIAEIYAMILPKNERALDYLTKAGEVARSVRSFPKAIELYDWIYQKYPDSEKAAQALFLKAFTLDDQMKKYDEAKVLYEEFLAKYPNDDFADDTRFLLENLGKSEEEIIKAFEKKVQ